MSGENLTDRDRLAMAFADLRELGYSADITLGYTACCRDCALREIAITKEVDDEGNVTEIALPDKFVFWYVQKDDYSFVGEEGFPVPEQYQHLDEEALQAIQPELDAAITAERLSKYGDLVNPLNLHWLGSADVIVGVLRKHGLNCSVPNSEHWCIEVTPSRMPAPLPTSV